MAQTMTCTTCHGKGTKTVPDEYAQTLAVLRRLRRATVSEIAAALAWKGNLTAIHQRISRMEEWHLVKRIGQKLPQGETDPRKRAWVFEPV